MKHSAKVITGVLLGAAMLFTTAAAVPAAAAENNSSVELTFTDTVKINGERMLLDQYVCKDNKTVKLINEQTLYSCDTSTGVFTVETTFPNQQQFNPSVPQTGSFRKTAPLRAAYINENTGMLYYAYDKYSFVNSTNAMAVEVVSYDLERSRVSGTFELAGENVSSVGADDSGNIFLGVRKQYADFTNTDALYVLSADGAKLAQTAVTAPVDTFCGFTDSGEFFFAATASTNNGDGTYSVSRSLSGGVFSGGKVTLDGKKIANLNYSYNRPARLTGGYLATYQTVLYKPADGSAVASFPGTQKADSSFTANFCTANTVIEGDLAYVVTDNHDIICYHISDGTTAATYQTDKTIVSMTKGGDGVMLLTKEGTRYSYLPVPFGAFAQTETTVYDLNELSVYQRSKADIVSRFAQSVPQDYDEQFFASEGSVTAPYEAYPLTEATAQNAVSVANYYRWLGGLSGFTSADATIWDNAAKGAVLTQKNCELTGKLSHYPDKPADMDDAFYQAGYTATGSSNIAYGFGFGQEALLDLSRAFLNDEGYTIPGHRDTFMTRNGDRFAAGYAPLGAVNTIQYQVDPNPLGSSVIGNDQPAYAWPAPGYFPEKEISTKAVWTVNLNTDYAGLTARPFSVTITDLDTGEQFVRDSQETGLYTTTNWGRFISFLPPTADSYSGKRYHVEVNDLANPQGLPVKVEYTVNFFSYGDEVEIDGVVYTADDYGRLHTAAPAVLLGDVNGNGVVDIGDVTEIQQHLAQMKTLTGDALAAADVDGDGDITIADATAIQRYLAEFVSELGA